MRSLDEGAARLLLFFQNKNKNPTHFLSPPARLFQGLRYPPPFILVFPACGHRITPKPIPPSSVCFITAPAAWFTHCFHRCQLESGPPLEAGVSEVKAAAGADAGSCPPKKKTQPPHWLWFQTAIPRLHTCGIAQATQTQSLRPRDEAPVKPSTFIAACFWVLKCSRRLIIAVFSGHRGSSSEAA